MGGDAKVFTLAEVSTHNHSKDCWLIIDGKATFECLLKTYGFLTPDFWRETRFTKSPFQEYTDLLAKPTKAIILDDVEKLDA